MKDRYSMWLRKSFANPDLNEGNTLNYSLDYSGTIADRKIRIDLSIYYSSLRDAIIEVYRVDSDDPNVFQLQKHRRSRIFWNRYALCLVCNKTSFITGKLCFCQKNNLTDPDVKFTNVPKHTVYAAFSAF